MRQIQILLLVLAVVGFIWLLFGGHGFDESSAMKRPLVEPFSAATPQRDGAPPSSPAPAESLREPAEASSPARIGLDRYLTGRVVDDRGKPVAQQSLEIAFAAGGFLAAWLAGPARDEAVLVTTNQGGFFSAPYPRDGKLCEVAAVLKGEPRFVLKTMPIQQGGVRLGDLVLPDPEKIEGVVRRTDGSPVANARVSFYPSEQGLVHSIPTILAPQGSLLHENDDFGYTLDITESVSEADRRHIATMNSDENGRFEFRGRATAPVFSIESEDGVPHYYDCEDWRPGKPLNLVLHAMEESVFQVVDETGAPAVGVEAFVARASCWPNHEVLLPVGRTSEQGTVRASVEGPDYCAIAARWSPKHPWHLQDHFDLPDLLGEERTPLILHRPMTIRIQVLDERGRGLEQATLSAFDALTYLSGISSKHSLQLDFKHLGHGTFEANGVPPGPVLIEARHPGYMPGRPEIEDGLWELQDRTATIELHPSKRLDVRVELAEGGAPVAGIPIYAGSMFSWSSEEVPCEEHTAWWAEGGISDDHGAWSFEQLCTRGTNISIQLPSEVITKSWDGSDSELTFEIEDLVRLEGQVTQHSKPIAGARIRMSRTGSFDSLEIRCDGNGHFETYLVGSGSYLISVYSPTDDSEVWDYALLYTWLQVEDERHIELDLEIAADWRIPTGRVRGFVRLDGEPARGLLSFECVPGATSLDALGEATRHSRGVLSIGHLEEDELEVTPGPDPRYLGILLDEQGSFELAVPAGATRVRFDGLKPRRLHFGQGPLDLLIDAGRTTDLNLEIRTGLLQIRVTDSNDGPMAGARVLVHDLSSNQVRNEGSTDGDGIYELKLPLGQYKVLALRSGTSDWFSVDDPEAVSTETRVNSGEATEITLRMN